MKRSVKKQLLRWGARASAMAISAQLMMVEVFAASSSKNDPNANLTKVTEPIIGLVNQVLNVLIPLVAAVGAVFSISLGLKYSKAEEPQEREKAKQHLKSAIIGFSLIFILIVALRVGSPLLEKWMNNASK